MNIGVSGTRKGATALQICGMIEILRAQDPYGYKVHHGCCIGVDEQFSIIALSMGCVLVAHPPDSTKFMSFIALDLSSGKMIEAEYLERNRRIVSESDIMLIVPETTYETNRSGTWATYRYAKASKVPTYIIYPNGSWVKE